MSKLPNLSRRKALGGIVSGLAAAGAGAGAFVTMSGPAAAASFDFSDTVQISSDDGSIEYVAVYGDSKVTWDGFDTDAEQFSIEVYLEISDADVTDHLLHDTGTRELTEDWGGSGESSTGAGTSGEIKQTVGLTKYGGDHDPETDWHIIGIDPDDYGLPNDPVAASKVNVGPASNPENDNTGSFEVTMESVYKWYDGAGEKLFEETFTNSLTVEVTNEGQEASAESGDGESGAIGE